MPGCWSYCFWRYCFEASSIILLFRGKNRIFCAFIKFLPCGRRCRPRRFASKVFVHLFQAGQPPLALAPVGLAVAAAHPPAGLPKQSFRPPFSKGGRIPKGGALWPPSADGGTLYPSGVFGGLGAFTRERPPRPLLFAPIRRQTASPMGRWRAAPEGALAICFPAAAGGPGTEKFLSFGISRLPP